MKFPMQNYEFSKISSSTFSVEKNHQHLPKIHETFLASLHKNILVRIIPTEEFIKLPHNNLVKRDNSGRILVQIPKEIRPWDVISIIFALDNFEGSVSSLNNVTSLAQMFLKLSKFIFTYIKDLDEGDDVAFEMGLEYYNFGNYLLENVLCNLSEDTFFQTTLSEEEEKDSEIWLLGESFYEDKNKKLNRKIHYSLVNKLPIPENVSLKYRIINLKKFFSELSVEPNKYRRYILKSLYNSQTEYPFLDLMKDLSSNRISNLIQKLKDESSLQSQQYEYLEKFLGSNFTLEKQKFFARINLEFLKNNLKVSRKKGNIIETSKLEISITNLIQDEILNFPYRNLNFYFHEITKKELMDTLASICLAYMTLRELEIDFFTTFIGNIIVFQIVTSENSIYWRDFTPKNGDRYNLKLHSQLFIDESLNFETCNINEVLGTDYKETTISIMKWCHTITDSGKRAPIYTFITPKIDTFKLSDFKVVFCPKEACLNNLIIYNLAINLINISLEKKISHLVTDSFQVFQYLIETSKSGSYIYNKSFENLEKATGFLAGNF